MTDQPTGDFDGCNSECRKAGKHSLRWGGCEHATPPEPTVSMSVVYTDPTDGYPAIGFDTYTVPQLAELIEPALNATALRAWRKPSEVAAEVARAIVHRHDEERPAVPVSSPPPDQTALVPRAVRPLDLEHDELMDRAAAEHQARTAAETARKTADQAAVLREAADHFDARATAIADVSDDPAIFVAKDRRKVAGVWRDGAAELRRLAAEAQQPDTKTRL